MPWLRTAGQVLISRRLRAVLSIGMVIGISVVGTLALWSSTVNTRSGQFTTATISIFADDVVADDTKTATFAFAPSGLLPGQSAAKVVTVTNTGSAALTYTALVSSGNALGRGMRLTVIPGATAAANGTCSAGTALTTNTAITATPTAFTTGRGTVAATNGSDPLCLQLTLPPDAPANLAGTSGSVLFTFNGSAGT